MDANNQEDPWAALSRPQPDNDWLNAALADTLPPSLPGIDSVDGIGNDMIAAAPAFDWRQPFDRYPIPIGRWVDQGLAWTVEHFRDVFQQIRMPIDTTLALVERGLQSVPALLAIALFGLLAWQAGGRRLAIGSVVSLLLIGFIGVWPQAMTTLSLVITSVAFCLAIGLPLGILAARSERLEKILHPLLDAMQTTPAFVYLVPVVMLFGIGNVPGVVVTIVFALAPLVRLTSLGIRQVRPDLIEAARSFGATPWQLLTRVQLPLALPTIMAGVNQTLMLSLSMVVIASMIAVGGLGQMVLRGIGRLDMGLATVGGLGIVILAIVLDRLTQALIRRERGAARWHARGPLGWLRRCTVYGIGGIAAGIRRLTATHKQERANVIA